MHLLGYGRWDEKSVGQVTIKVWRERHVGNQLVTRSAFINCELVNGRNFHSILGAKACERLNLIEVKDSDAMNLLPGEATKNMFLSTQRLLLMTMLKGRLRAAYPHIFSDAIGHIGDHHIKINHKVDLVQHPPRQVPVTLHKKLFCELQKL